VSFITFLGLAWIIFVFFVASLTFLAKVLRYRAWQKAKDEALAGMTDLHPDARKLLEMTLVNPVKRQELIATGASIGLFGLALLAVIFGG
jgi:hypothetical protein